MQKGESQSALASATASEASLLRRTARGALRLVGHSPVYWLARIPLTAVLLLIAFWTFIPVLWTFATSFKGVKEYYLWSLSLIPHHPTLHNYIFMFKYLPDFPLYFRNSAIVCLSVVFLNLFYSSLMGYAFARMRFRGRDLLFYSIVISMFIPRSGSLMAAYELMSFLHLRNSLVGLVLFFSSEISVSLFIMRQTFVSMPREIEESAMIDGASRWRIFTAIALPYAAAGMMVVAVLSFVGTWGDYLFTITMIDVAKYYTVGVGIAMFSGAGHMVQQDPDISEAGILAAGYLLAALPAMLLYLGLQRYFVRGLMEGALKF